MKKILLCLLLLAGCTRAKDAKQAVAPVAMPDPASLGPASASLLAGTWDPQHDLELRDAFVTETQALLDAKNYALIEQMAGYLRQSKLELPSGDSALHEFYGALWSVGMGGMDEEDRNELWPPRVEAIHQWVDHSGSGEALLVAGTMETRLAWQSRGTGWASTVTADGYKGFEEHLAAAQGYLEKAGKLIPDDPCLDAALVVVGLAQNAPKSQEEQWVAAAAQANPRFLDCDEGFCFYLLPRWHGQPGEMEAFVDQVAKREGGQGPQAYALLTCNLFASHRNQLFVDTALDRQRAGQAFQEMTDKVPSQRNFSRWAIIASLTPGLKQQAHDLFEKIDGHYDRVAWGRQTNFQTYHDWAYQP